MHDVVLSYDDAEDVYAELQALRYQLSGWEGPGVDSCKRALKIMDAAIEDAWKKGEKTTFNADDY